MLLLHTPCTILQIVGLWRWLTENSAEAHTNSMSSGTILTGTNVCQQTIVMKGRMLLAATETVEQINPINNKTIIADQTLILQVLHYANTAQYHHVSQTDTRSCTKRRTKIVYVAKQRQGSNSSTRNITGRYTQK